MLQSVVSDLDVDTGTALLLLGAKFFQIHQCSRHLSAVAVWRNPRPVRAIRDELLSDWLEAYIAASELVSVGALHLVVSFYKPSPHADFTDLCPRSQLPLTEVNEASNHSGHGKCIGGNNPPPHLKSMPRFSVASPA